MPSLGSFFLCLALAPVQNLAPQFRRRLPRLRATPQEEELARLREEIKELEADYERDVAARAPPVEAEVPARPKIPTAAAITDRKVNVDAVCARLDASLLPAGADAAAEKRAFAEFCGLEKMEGEGLKQVEVGDVLIATVDGNSELISLLSGTETVKENDVADLKRLVDQLVDAVAASLEAGEEAKWGDVAERMGDVSEDGEGEGEGDEIFGIPMEPDMTPQVLSLRVNERFHDCLGEHWKDWCNVAEQRANGAFDADVAAAYGAAVERLRPRARLCAVSPVEFAEAVRTNASVADDVFPRAQLFDQGFREVLREAAEADERSAADLERLWTALSVATLRTTQTVEQARRVAAYLFERVLAADEAPREFILDKLRDSRLIPRGETDARVLEEEFVGRVAQLVNIAGPVLAAAVWLATGLFVWALFTFLLGPLFGGIFDAVSRVVAPGDDLVDAFDAFAKK